MNATPTVHPSPDELAAFGQGRLNQETQAEIARHVAGCDSCCQALRRVPDDTLAGRLRGGATTFAAPLSGDPKAKPPIVETHLELPRELIDHPRYRMVKALGAGGMGVVYRAEHRHLERPVAIKIIHRNLTSHPMAVERFALEIKAAGKLSHPNIVATHDAERAGDVHFLVMEFVDGASLARVVEKRGPLPVVHACNYIRQAALGLQHAHERGMVHRDIKPQNLMLTRKGQVKILDFGLARLVQERGPIGDTPHLPPGGQPGLTAAGTVLGTPDYIAPEQASDSRQVDIRADIYSLGCTLYFLLVGRPPFPQGSLTEKVEAHIESEPPPLTDLRDDLPPGLADLVQQMMAKNPGVRYQTPAEVALALVPFAKASAPAPVLDLPVAEVIGTPLVETPEQRGADTFVGGPGVHTQAPARSRTKRLRFKPKKSRSRGVLVPLLIAMGAVVLLGGAAWVAYEAVQHARAGMAEGPTSPKQPLSGKTVTLPPSTQQPAPIPPVTPPTGAGQPLRALYVLPQNGLWYDDFGPVRDYLVSNGVKVDTASSEGRKCSLARGSSGESVMPDFALDQVKAADYDVIIFAGSEVQEYCFVGGIGRQKAQELMAEMLDRKKRVAGLCKGQIVLHAAGHLRGKPAALDTSSLVYQFAVKLVGMEDVVAVDVPCQVSGQLITGRSPQDAQAFAEAVLTQIRK